MCKLQWWPDPHALPRSRCAGCFVVLALLANYSGFLFCRLYRSTPGAVLFGDIGYKAAGSLGRNLVYATIYSLDATQCVILHLAASQSLRHIFPGDWMPSLWQCGAAIVPIACIMVQVGWEPLTPGCLFDTLFPLPA